ncbi:SGNH/GDSL hydrolase family protein [Microbacterium hydrocarbonoxydans]|uniref:SGNH/GDSL hydrolase family protein n=1 Tax=Microbacterium hydrocarbonoxydans TaxID=273678 RepID=UPI0007BBD1F4|nr:SGNH/GDSL hydrolase family protein [Microbacterium hydrocarbonoxydans]GAT74514.1 AO11 [Microbacterium sp. HM58-2]
MSARSTRDGRALRYATDHAPRTIRHRIDTASAAPAPARRAIRLLALFLVAAGLAVGAAPAYAAPGGNGGGGGGKPANVAYAALGDSFAAGQGAGSYLNTTCYVSSKGYPALIDADRKIDLVSRPACSGSSTLEVVSVQVPQVPATASRVTLTAGGNDVGFGAVMQNCFIIVNNSACSQAIAAGDAMVQDGTVTNRIAAAVNAIRAKAPNAKIIVTGYPRLFEPTVTRAYAQQVNTSTTALNAAIRAGAQSAGAVFVDVEGAFTGHGIGSASPWINDWSWLNTSAGFHPNASGYVAYSGQIKLAW